jgi:regulator of cell morphogenesis and NO signaling
MHTNTDNSTDNPLAVLMDDIVARHHTFCRQEVARLLPLFKQVTAAHGKEHPELKRMQELFSTLARDLQMHLVKEEQTLFPYIVRVEEAVRRNDPVSWPPFGSVENPIRVMVEEHDRTDEELKLLRELSNGFMPPAGAPEAYAALYEGLRAFERDMGHHIHAEDDLLFPRAVAMEQQACAAGS